jgi:hypothetical protein
VIEWVGEGVKIGLFTVAGIQIKDEIWRQQL